jgi:hypothetical protein
LIAAVAVFVVAFWTQRWVLDLPLTAIDTIPTIAAARIESWTEIFEVAARELRGGVTDHYYYRPLTLMSYTVDQWLWSGSAWGYHFTDVLFHSLAAVSVFAVGRRAVDLPRLASLLAATLFLIHPAIIEVVPAITRRQEPMLVIGYCISLLGARIVPKRAGWLLMILGSLIAVGSAERGLVVPALVFAFLFFYRFAGFGLLRRVLESVRWTVPAIIVAIAFFLLRTKLYGSAGIWVNAAHFVDIPVQFGFWLIYPQQRVDFIFPTNLAQAALTLLVAAPFLLAFVYPILRTPRRHVLWFGLSWIVANVLLVSIAGMLNPWYIYSAVPGYVLIIVFFAVEALRLSRRGSRAKFGAGVAAAAAVILLLLMSVASPVAREYRAWRVAGELSEQLLADLGRVDDELPTGEPLVVINLPAQFREIGSDYLVTRSAAILWPSSITAWRREQQIERELIMLGAANFVEQVAIPEIEFHDDRVQVYFVEGESTYTDGNGAWPGASMLPPDVGRGYSFPWPGDAAAEVAPHVFVFDGTRLIRYDAKS